MNPALSRVGVVFACLLCMAAACRRSPVRPEAAAGRTVASAPERPPAAAVRSGYAFTPQEEAAVQEMLRRHPDLRVATDEDRRGEHSGDGDVRGLYGVYHPYFVRGDVNDDGVMDFVLAFVDRDSSRGSGWFTVVVFTGRGEGRGYQPGVFLERGVSLARGDLSVDRDAILITPDLSDEAVRRYRWDPVHRSYVFVRDEDSEETPLPAQT